MDNNWLYNRISQLFFNSLLFLLFFYRLKRLLYCRIFFSILMNTRIYTPS